MKRLASAIAAGALLYTSGQQVTHDQPPVLEYHQTHNTHFSAEDMLQLRQTQEAVAGWAGATSVPMILLQGEESYPSARSNYPDYYTGDDPQYDPKQRIVVIGAEGFNDFMENSTDHTVTGRRAMTRFVIAHEFGHEWQVQEGIVEPGTKFEQKLELQADCRAGMAAAQLFSEDISAIQAQITHMGGGEHHGSVSQRTEMFIKGAKEGNC
jgi:hypothetical protein